MQNLCSNVVDICNDNIKIASIGEDIMEWIETIDGIELKKPMKLLLIANLLLQNILDFIDSSYKEEIFDEFIIPTSF